MRLRAEKKIQQLLWSVIDFLYTPFQKTISLQFFRYGFCGGLNMCIDWVLYFIFYNFIFHKQVVDLGFVAFTPHIASFVFKFPITFLTGFWLSRHVSFSDSQLRGRVQIVRYLLVVGGCILINYAGLKLFVEVCGFYPTPSNILTSIIAAIFSYFSNKYFSFKH
ncbi:MAG: GtrA family protein [Sphingobacteriia bacterium]|jgi:putative flippase GtrA|nr:GtrA family protein [Paludibacteraceae bacterium]NCA79481.1 GtrA family protein [Sphingobacteriia bacterium]